MTLDVTMIDRWGGAGHEENAGGHPNPHSRFGARAHPRRLRVARALVRNLVLIYELDFINSLVCARKQLVV